MEKEIKPGMLVRWKDWRELPWRPTGLVFEVYGTAIHERASIRVMWSGRTEIEHCLLRFVEPVTDEPNA